MTFVESVRSVLTQYAVFTGRARRSEYWWFALFSLAVGIVGSLLGVAIGPIPRIVLSLALLLPGLGVLVRRLHDTGRSGWWFWIALIPLVGFIVLLVFLCGDSHAGANKYGPSPKYGGDPGYPAQYPGYPPPPPYGGPSPY